MREERERESRSTKELTWFNLTTYFYNGKPFRASTSLLLRSISYNEPIERLDLG